MDQTQERDVPSGSRNDFDLGAVADGLDGERRARAASRIASHFSELRGDVERLQERVTRQGQLIQSLEERLKSIESASKSASKSQPDGKDRAAEAANGAKSAPRRRLFG